MTAITAENTMLVGNTELVQPARRRFRRAGRMAFIVTIAIVAWNLFAVPVTARLTRPTRMIAVGADWGHGYVVVPQRRGADDVQRRRDAAEAELLARQNGFAIVADTGADHVFVVHSGRASK